MILVKRLAKNLLYQVCAGPDTGQMAKWLVKVAGQNGWSKKACRHGWSKELVKGLSKYIGQKG